MNGFNNFTPRAQRAIQLATREADRFNHAYVGTEHLLLGLVGLGEGVPSCAMIARTALRVTPRRRAISRSGIPSWWSRKMALRLSVAIMELPYRVKKRARPAQNSRRQ